MMLSNVKKIFKRIKNNKPSKISRETEPLLKGQCMIDVNMV